MNWDHLAAKAASYLQRLCVDIPNRRTGSPGNRAATDLFAQAVAAFGFEVECPQFDCLDWTHAGASLSVGLEPFEVFVGTYSLGGRFRPRLAVVSSVEELAASAVHGAILLLRGDIAKEQLMPKNFPFYNPDEHKRIIALLETRPPQAVASATARNPETVGAVYPCPLIEDGDLDIPSVYMTEEEGNRLAGHAGEEVVLEIRSHRTPATGCNVLARKGADPRRRVVLCAHIDAREGTPGALDNASGVVTLLLLAELLRNHDGRLGIELVALNGEDHYSAAGQILYLKRNAGRLGEILVAFNLDDVGYQQGKAAFSLYGCPDALASSIRAAFSRHADMLEGPPWYQGDHMVFMQNGVPAVAITSEEAMQYLATITHSVRDRPELVDSAKLVHIALAVQDLLLDLEHGLAPGDTPQAA